VVFAKPEIIEIKVLELLFTDPQVDNLFDKTKVITLANHNGCKQESQAQENR